MADNIRKHKTKELGAAGLNALRRFLAEVPGAAREWPRQAWDMVRFPADLVLGNPEQNRLDREWEGSGMKPLVADPTLQARGPERRARQVAEFANPLANAVFAPKQALALASSPLGQATLGGLAALTVGVGPVATAPMMAGVVKPKGGNWLSGSVEDALRGLQKRPGVERHDPETFSGMPQRAIEDAKRDFSLDQWIEGPLTKYVKTRMASPDDEVRRLAEQGVLHVDPSSLRYGQRQVHPSGEHLQKLAQNPDALKWENAADFAIYPEQARTFKNSVSGSTGRPTIERNPWLANLSDDAPVYDLTQNMATQDLGFPHLIDELSNALNPASGLPRNLQLTPEAIPQMSMEKAVRRVAEINAWRAAQKIEANRKLAEQAALVREYAENNPKGLRWVELKDPGVPTEFDASRFVVQDGPRGGRGVFDTKQNSWFVPPTSGMTDEQLMQHALDSSTKDGRRQALADQLKYEGDTMGHCVGGYCDEVLSGRSRIFSLRDAKGEPHVTVEVAPDPESLTDAYRWDKPSIVQIKGKQNRAPNEEYLPFVQDFVRNSPLGGQWSDVGDLANTGLYDARQYSSSLGRLVDDLVAGRGHPFVTPEEYNLMYEKGQLPEFASGGRVQLPPKDQAPITTGIRGNSEGLFNWRDFDYNVDTNLEAA